VEVAVEHDRGWAAGFAVSPLEQGLQGGGIAVQATDDIDLWYARLAEAAGLRVERIEVARRLRRRGTDSDFLRESLVVLTK
jgi:hypothetical protein